MPQLFICLTAQEWDPLRTVHVTSTGDRTQFIAVFQECWLNGKTQVQKRNSEVHLTPECVYSHQVERRDESRHTGKTYPSFLAHSKLGPNTIAMLLGVILLMSLVWASFARNLIKYLWKKREERKHVLWNLCTYSILLPTCSVPDGSGANCRVPLNQNLAQVQYFTKSCVLCFREQKAPRWGLEEEKSSRVNLNDSIPIYCIFLIHFSFMPYLCTPQLQYD